MDKILEVRSLSKSYPLKKNFWGTPVQFLEACVDVSFTLNKEETLGIVGESGCGKSTLAKAMLALTSVTSGEVLFNGQSLQDLRPQNLRKIRRQMQMIFQDPYSSLNPRMSIEEILREPFLIHNEGSKEDQDKIIHELLEKVGLPLSCLSAYPSSFSGGQRQRIAIARALALKPELVIADEPVSALDVTIQARILSLFSHFRKSFGFSCVFISHDLAVVEHISDKVAVMYLGRVVEYAEKNELFQSPLHPYTKALLEAVPQAVYRPEPRKKTYDIGSLEREKVPKNGCAFYPRCPLATAICQKERPVLKPHHKSQGFHKVACHKVD